jgi:predicted RNA-binding Zn-ribbon protein involved in translation (DUF1610 family)
VSKWRTSAEVVEPRYRSGVNLYFAACMEAQPLLPTRPSGADFVRRILASAKKCKHCGEFLDRARVADSSSVPNAGDIICPNANCRYEGPPRKVARGSIIVGVILLFLFLLPGILYFLFMGGHRYQCPRCGMVIRSQIF